MFSKAAKTDTETVAAMLAEVYRELEVDGMEREVFQARMEAQLGLNRIKGGELFIRYDQLTSALFDVLGRGVAGQGQKVWNAYASFCGPNVFVPAAGNLVVWLDPTWESACIVKPPLMECRPDSALLLPEELRGVCATSEGWEKFTHRLLDLIEGCDPADEEGRYAAVASAAEGVLFEPLEWPEAMREYPEVARALQSPLGAYQGLLRVYDPLRHVRLNLEAALNSGMANSSGKTRVEGETV